MHIEIVFLMLSLFLVFLSCFQLQAGEICRMRADGAKACWTTYTWRSKTYYKGRITYPSGRTKKFIHSETSFERNFDRKRNGNLVWRKPQKVESQESQTEANADPSNSPQAATDVTKSDTPQEHSPESEVTQASDDEKGWTPSSGSVKKIQDSIKCIGNQPRGRIKMTQYFSGKSATSVEGSKFMANRGKKFLVPCFSIACPPGRKSGDMVYAPGMVGLKCHSKVPIGQMGDILKNLNGYSNMKKSHTYRWNGRKYKASYRQGLKKWGEARGHLKCQGDTCENVTGLFRCEDSGNAVKKRNHFDLYIGDCDGKKKSTRCRAKAGKKSTHDQIQSRAKNFCVVRGKVKQPFHGPLPIQKPKENAIN